MYEDMKEMKYSMTDLEEETRFNYEREKVSWDWYIKIERICRWQELVRKRMDKPKSDMTKKINMKNVWNQD
jgi:hypothetical protein